MDQPAAPHRPHPQQQHLHPHPRIRSHNPADLDKIIGGTVDLDALAKLAIGRML
jgi:hypothetical protein